VREGRTVVRPAREAGSAHARARAKMYRTVRSYYVMAVAVFRLICAAAAVVAHRPVVVGFVAVVAVLDAAAMWWALRGARVLRSFRDQSP
jgi:hypothetical protein